MLVGSESDIWVMVPVPSRPIFCPSHPGPRKAFKERLMTIRAARIYVNKLIPSSCVMIENLDGSVSASWSKSSSDISLPSITSNSSSPPMFSSSKNECNFILGCQNSRDRINVYDGRSLKVKLTWLFFRLEQLSPLEKWILLDSMNINDFCLKPCSEVT